MKLSIIILISTILLFGPESCGDSKSKAIHIPYSSYASETVKSSNTIDIPYTLENGVKYVQVKINGLSTDMIFDTGCSLTLISVLEAQQLAKRGLISEEDFVGTSHASIADGSLVEDALFNIRTLELSDGQHTIICRNVLTQVSSNIEAPVLLGNGVLDRVASYTIDNNSKIIRFSLK